MATSFIIVDDFLENPAAVRKLALGLDYEFEGNFPGRNSRQRLDLPGLADYVSHLTGEPLKPIDPLGSHGKCRVTLASDPKNAGIHVDDSQWSGILYLSRNEDCRGGTRFFRHKRSGTDRAPINDIEAQAMGYSSVSEACNTILDRDAGRPSAWEKTFEIPMRFNRLVMLRPWFWHTSCPGFGNSLENGRLIQVMFFTLDPARMR
ncbi:hypothetical protein J3454_04150 [Erythrobacter sp. NFXS35]|uniref:DUF6445 family protein n=1 Tax=Erythrobacter sp. NFXS35 TaxID=2818436 RepID=UPI0032DFF5CE